MDSLVNTRPFSASIRRWWWVLLVVTAVAAGIGYLVSSLSGPTYQASVKLLVGPVNADSDTQKSAGTLAGTYTHYVLSGPVLRETAAAVGVAQDTDRWSSTAADGDEVSRFLTISVESDDPATAARIANTLAATLDARVAARSLGPEADLTVVEPATPPTTTVGPEPGRAALASGVAAFLGVFALAVLVETTGILRRRGPRGARAGTEAVPGATDQLSAR